MKQCHNGLSFENVLQLEAIVFGQKEKWRQKDASKWKKRKKSVKVECEKKNYVLRV